MKTWKTNYTIFWAKEKAQSQQKPNSLLYMSVGEDYLFDGMAVYINIKKLMIF